MILERDLGLEISRATLDGWVLKVGELLIPRIAAMRRELIGGSYIQADETPVDVQTREGRGKNHQAYLWQYSRPGGTVVFDFRLGDGRDGPKRFLGHFEGILQTDGYAAYDQIGGPKMVHAACWSHARRQFFEAVQLNPRDPDATPIVARMDELVAVEAEARRKTLTTAARHIRRQEAAKPLLDDIRSKIEAAQSVASPSSTLSKACQRALALWKKLNRRCRDSLWFRGNCVKIYGTDLQPTKVAPHDASQYWPVYTLCRRMRVFCRGLPLGALFLASTYRRLEVRRGSEQQRGHRTNCLQL